MIVHDLYVVSACPGPAKADSELVVYADTVLSAAFSLERLQPVSRRNAQVGFSVSERTVSRYLRSFRARPNTGANWKTFLQNHRHQITATDFFTVPTSTFKNIYVLFMIEHHGCRITHFAVTRNPTAAWVIQPMREAFPYDSAPRYLIMDNDSTFSDAVTDSLETFGVITKRTSF